jgi:RimJ/RimL family protein N-acetyltransferase
MLDFELYRPIEDDWESIREIRLRALADEPAAFLERLADVERFDEAEWRARARRNLGPGSLQLIARQTDGRWIASMTIFTSQGPPAYLGQSDGGAPRANLVGVWVDPQFRGAEAGVADAVLLALCEWVRDELGLDRLYLHVGDWNSRARRFYERHGFRPTGVTEKLPGDLSDFEYELVRELTTSVE